ncbi:pseudoazurin [Bacteroidota bacterium]|nr:pseudoazurin [Bacteroidota bacterium]|tara:strand:+ start:3122 stop:3553 length:432 start_codon:yes stop_codon:yes gene_type:complete
MKNLLLCVVIVWSFAISSEEYEVKMLNFGNDGSMVFEPGFLKVNVGDTVHFKSVDMAHNSESSTGLIPVNASGWKGNINEDISITLTEEGVYVYQCTPHLILGMVGVIQVGNPTNIDQIKENLGSLTFAVNAERLQGYIDQVN